MKKTIRVVSASGLSYTECCFDKLDGVVITDEKKRSNVRHKSGRLVGGKSLKSDGRPFPIFLQE